MSQSQQFPPSRRQTQTDSSYGSSSQHDELHMSGVSQHAPQMSMSPRDYAPQIKLEPSPGNPQYQSTSSVPNVLQPAGGLSARPPSMSANTTPNLSAMQSPMSHQQHQGPQQQLSSLSSSSSQQPSQPQGPQDYQGPPKPSLSMSHSHSYSRSSPAVSYDAPGYHAYTPTTPGGAASSQFMSPTDAGKFNVPGSQRNISNTPLGLADIRPRADSSMSDGTPGPMGHDWASTQPGTSNYMAPWAIYAFDWCKWAPQGNSAGKLAVGSYLEDGHNFVRSCQRADSLIHEADLGRFKFWIVKSFLLPKTSTHLVLPNTVSISPKLPRQLIHTQ